MPYPHPFIKLTEEEKKIIKFEMLKSRQRNNKSNFLRLKVLQFSNNGFTFKSIAEILDRSYAWVRQTIYMYRKDGLKPFILP